MTKLCLRHRYFSRDEWVTMNGLYEFEDGVIVGPSGWTDKIHTGWELFKPLIKD